MRRALTGYSRIELHEFKGKSYPQVLTEITQFVQKQVSRGESLEYNLMQQYDIETEEHVFFLYVQE